MHDKNQYAPSTITPIDTINTIRFDREYSMFYGDSPVGKSAAAASKIPTLPAAKRASMVAEVLGDSPDDMAIFEYLRSHGMLDILYRVIPEHRVRQVRQTVIRWVLAVHSS